MALPLYLAMTAAEMDAISHFPRHTGYMACHFSPYGTGLCNLPKGMPPGGLLTLNDRIPWHGHDEDLVTKQLCELVDSHQCACLLLDFQRPGCKEAESLARTIGSALPCPVGVSEFYAESASCPVFLPPVPPDIPIGEYLASWKGREIWLEAALDAMEITLTEDGSRTAPLSCLNHPKGNHRDETLHCHYSITASPEQVKFTLYRTRADLDELLAEAEAHGVTRAVGLWQEFGK